jgi:hypothetical protein
VDRLPGPFTSLIPSRRWVVALSLGASLLALAVGSPWLGRSSPSLPQRPGGGSVGKDAPGPVQPIDPMAFVQARADTASSSNLNELVQAYGQWSSRSDALPARRAIVGTLLGHASLEVGLHLLLTAVEGDPTAREQDPMWTTLVQQVAARWDAGSLSHGRDLLQLETRPRARDLLLESLAHARPEKLTPRQRPLLASDFIDLFADLRPDQKPMVNRALHLFAGSDVVEILSGRGLAGGGRSLKVTAERRRTLDSIGRSAAREAPTEP